MSKRSENRRHIWFVVILAILLAFFLFAFGREYVSNVQVRHYIEDLEEQREQQETQQLETMTLIQQLSSEYFLEYEGRMKQGLGGAGETVIVIQEDKEADMDLAQQHNTGITNVTRWFYYFFSPERFEELKVYEGV